MRPTLRYDSRKPIDENWPWFTPLMLCAFGIIAAVAVVAVVA